ncbi:hypothetical protein M3P05_08285 [Sansalvadorimonas sp. 2012CJ34-2]|uniref:C2H2-type domain-containing protein n=1 Tax=Parendozoicomonas callyspongiae TaxID=2942213 RepID=A0ABT0PEY3_9GAMM|nr:hypothetical protein [Sansalvadorimonas sp. 2012CJ34-2]MCL6269934.1 hypothetical protein [Sansalvadorimonas sp. 2012CJ34-2]
MTIVLLLCTRLQASYEKHYKAYFLTSNIQLQCMECGSYPLNPRQISCPYTHLVCDECLPAYGDMFRVGDRENYLCKWCTKKPGSEESSGSEKKEDEIFQKTYSFQTGRPEWFNKLLASNIVKCGNFKYGCTWRGEYGHLAAHTAECQEKQKTCDTCGSKYMETHEALHNRSHGVDLDCQFCGKTVNSPEFYQHLKFFCDGKNIANDGLCESGAAVSSTGEPTFSEAFANQEPVQQHFGRNTAYKRTHFLSLDKKNEISGCKACRKPVVRKSKQSFGRKITSPRGSLLCPWCATEGEVKRAARMAPPEDLYQYSVLSMVVGKDVIPGEYDVENGYIEYDRGIYYWSVDIGSEELKKDSGILVKVTLPDFFSGELSITMTPEGREGAAHFKFNYSKKEISRMLKTMLLMNQSGEIGVYTLKAAMAPDETISKRHLIFPIDSVMLIPVSDKGVISKQVAKAIKQKDIIEWRVENCSQSFLVPGQWTGKKHLPSIHLESKEFESGGNYMRFGLSRSEDVLNFYIDYVALDGNEAIKPTLFSVVINYAGQSWHFVHQNKNEYSKMINAGVINWLVFRDLLKDSSSDDTLKITAFPITCKISVSRNKITAEIEPKGYVIPEKITQPSPGNNNAFITQDFLYQEDTFFLELTYNAYKELVQTVVWVWRGDPVDQRMVLEVEIDTRGTVPVSYPTGVCRYINKKIVKNKSVICSAPLKYKKVSLGGQTMGEYARSEPIAGSEHKEGDISEEDSVANNLELATDRFSHISLDREWTESKLMWGGSSKPKTEGIEDESSDSASAVDEQETTF